MGEDERDKSNLTEPLVEAESGEAQAATESSISRGEVQPKKCRDPLFAILFYLHLAAMIAVTIVYGVPALEKSATSSTPSNGNTVEAPLHFWVLMGLAVGIAAIVICGLGMLFVLTCSQFLIQMSLIASFIVSIAFAVLAILSGNVIGIIFGVLYVLVMACYIRAVWHLIPFAAMNLKVGVTAIKKNFGVVFVGYLLVGIGLAYTFVWIMTWMGAYYQTAGCYQVPKSGGGMTMRCTGSMNGGYVFLLLLAFFWTQQVIQNTIHVSVAGTVGTWWFNPTQASSCCSPGVNDSLFRATTSSFGSICFGSLLVAIIQTIRVIAESMQQNARNNPDSGLAAAVGLCIATCLLRCIESIVRYFNKWAYVYVGLYGYPYLESGKRVMELFEARGWLTVISDDLVSRALLIMSFMIGILCGVVGVLIGALSETWKGLFDAGSGSAEGAAFGISFVIGLFLSSILMSVIASAVNTVIVCYAEAPSEFATNHEALSQEMRDTWRSTYPDVFA